MKNIRTQLSLLITLANSDGEFHERERQVIERVARSGDISQEELEQLIKQPDPVEGLDKMPYDDRFDYLYNVILLMKADSVIQDSELLFCQKIANSLGFQLAAFMELYPHVHVNMKAPEELRMMRKKLQDYHAE
ncbi:MAG: TerB family tellurite resistance protein [Imperialibacter sp.]|uniref:tellurite resistance TerB family protein n=1 Tax=Imperialibacter sp. TaxID=2038411 RepID=UPI0030D7E734|tara:strand:- start:191 stop:592 length:402 start_codon:yes stop_codon:yes gene_type:complete